MTGLVNLDVGGALSGVFSLIDNLFTSDEEREEAKFKVLQLHATGQLAQIAVNTVEAKSESNFVAGWRPFIGWTCGAAFAYSFLIQPFLSFVAWATFAATGTVMPIDTLPTLDLGMMMPVLMGMLGLGGLRTWEKFTGTNTNRTSVPTPAPRPKQLGDGPGRDGVY